MALFPKIDQPCPLDAEEFARIDGHCGRCNRVVHALDDMSDAQRAALLRESRGPLCVSYRVPARHHASRIGVGAAIALSVASPAFADIVRSGIDEANVQRSIEPKTPLLGPSAHGATCQDSSPSPDENKLEQITITGGGVRRPQDAEWIDDSALPDLPMVPVDASGE